jgi:hypothetical protein
LDSQEFSQVTLSSAILRPESRFEGRLELLDRRVLGEDLAVRTDEEKRGDYQ